MTAHHQSNPALPVPGAHAVTVSASEHDVRNALALGSPLARKAAAGLAAALVCAAGLWGDAVLDAQRGMRTDLRSLQRAMTENSDGLRADLVKTGAELVKLGVEHGESRRRLDVLEGQRQGLLERYETALADYERRNGIPRPCTSHSATAPPAPDGPAAR